MVGDRTEDSVLASDVRFACPRTEWDTVGKAGNHVMNREAGRVRIGSN